MDSRTFAQIDIEEQIAKAPSSANIVWPIEILTLVEQAFSANPNTKTEFRQQTLCERVNQRLLDNVLKHDIIAELNNMLARCEQVEDAA